MKKILYSLIIVSLFLNFNIAFASDMAEKLKGKILLQVEENGEGWYVNPDNAKRYYLGRPADAFSLMRELGLGISNSDFDSFNGYAPTRLSGKILLKVEDDGKAYYVNPDDLKMHYLGRPADAFQVMRELGLGISNNDLTDIEVNGVTSETIIKTDDNENSVKLSNTEIIEKLKDAVVYIETTYGSGSGFVVNEDGYILTNAHVINNVNSATIIFSDNSEYNATVVGRDEFVDLALLKVNKTNLYKAWSGDSDLVKQGDEVFTLGYPFGIKGDVSFKEGIISRRLNDESNEYFEISADIHPGNSGGPLVDRYGKVIGINTAVYGDSIQGITVGETIKLAIPVNVIKDNLTALQKGVNKINEAWDIVQEIPEQSDTSEFAIKTQCQQLGKEKKEEDDNVDYRSSLDSTQYGYSPSLNTCIYARQYGIWLQEGEYSHPYWSFQIWDLLTEQMLYRVPDQPIDGLKEGGLTEEEKQQVAEFWALYRELLK